MTDVFEQLSISTIRTLSIDAVQAADSGRPGTPMALAPLVCTLWNRVLQFALYDRLWSTICAGSMTTTTLRSRATRASAFTEDVMGRCRANQGDVLHVADANDLDSIGGARGAAANRAWREQRERLRATHPALAGFMGAAKSLLCGR